MVPQNRRVDARSNKQSRIGSRTLGADNKDVKAGQDVEVGRRNFLKGAAVVGGAAAVAAPAAVVATQAKAAPQPANPGAPRPAGPVSNADEGGNRVEGLTYDSCGGDY